MPYWVLSVYDLRRKEKALFHRTLLPTLPFQTKSDHIKPNQTFFGSLGFPVSSAGKESVCNAGDPGSIPGLGRCPGEGNGNPLLYSCLGNPMDRGAWWATVHEVVRVGLNLATQPPAPVTKSCLTLVTPWTRPHQVPPSMGFSR